MNAFIDTWGFKALIDGNEPLHSAVELFIKDSWANKNKIFTSDYVLDETITLLSGKLPFDKVKEFIEKISDARIRGNLYLLWVNEDVFNESIRYRLKFSDKSKISFTDFTSMVLMKKNGIDDVITADKHFNDVGMGFKVLF
jgi:uncharacterized protein